MVHNFGICRTALFIFIHDSAFSQKQKIIHESNNSWWCWDQITNYSWITMNNRSWPFFSESNYFMNHSLLHFCLSFILITTSPLQQLVLLGIHNLFSPLFLISLSDLCSGKTKHIRSYGFIHKSFFILLFQLGFSFTSLFFCASSWIYVLFHGIRSDIRNSWPAIKIDRKNRWRTEEHLECSTNWSISSTSTTFPLISPL